MKDHHQTSKYGRNSYCRCGSGKKYKKCCLYNEIVTKKGDELEQISKNKLMKKYSKDALVVNSEKMGGIKMSEVILEYADELLSMADTNKSKKNAIILAITAWNISHFDKIKQKNVIDDFLKSMDTNKNSHSHEEIHQIFQTLIDKKLFEYSSIDRLVIDFEFIELGNNNFHLNVVSTL